MRSATDPVLITRADGLQLSDDRARLDRGRIEAWLATTYWAADRSPELVARSIENSCCYGAYAPDGTQIGFTRATTDLASFAWLGDVIVDEAWRGRGVGRWMVGAVVEHLRAVGVPRFLLATRTASTRPSGSSRCASRTCISRSTTVRAVPRPTRCRRRQAGDGRMAGDQQRPAP